MDARDTRGLQLAAAKESRFRRKGEFWLVPSQSGAGSYVVDPSAGSCSCADFETRGARCKHVYAVIWVIQRQTAADGTTTVTESVTVTATPKPKKKTYAQNWPLYNLAQTVEQERVAALLAGLCAGVVSPPQTGRGQRRLPLGDMIFAAAMKVYGSKSARRTMTDLRGYTTAGLIRQTPHYNSIFVYFEDPTLTPILEMLIEESAAPLRALENGEFSTDATGFSTSCYGRWNDDKPGGTNGSTATSLRKKYVKLHVSVGVRTHVVAGFRVTDGHEHDSPFLPELIRDTAKHFQVKRVSADKGYLSHENLEAIDAIGATPYIPFKVNSQGTEGPALWRRLYHFFEFQREEFLKHYHQRSNAETVFWMIKSKFGRNVRSRTAVAQKNEVLLKVLCHNLCVLVMAIYELGADPVFWQNAKAPTKGAAS